MHAAASAADETRIEDGIWFPLGTVAPRGSRFTFLAQEILLNPFYLQIRGA